MIEGINNVLDEAFKNLNTLKENLTPEQRVELAKYEQKSKSMFKDVDLQNIDIEQLEKKKKELEKLSKNITKWQL